MTKLIFRFKGGKGSGFHGHSGRPGKVGGSSTARISVANPNIVDHYDQLKTNRQGEKAWMIMPDNRLFDLYGTNDKVYDHSTTIANNSEAFGLGKLEAEILSSPWRGEVHDKVWDKLFSKGFIRVREYTLGGGSTLAGQRAVNIQTSKLNTSTLKRLQENFGQAWKIDLNGFITWAESNPEGMFFDTDIEEFLGASRVGDMGLMDDTLRYRY